MKHNARRSIVALLLAVALVASFAFAGAATLQFYHLRYYANLLVG